MTTPSIFNEFWHEYLDYNISRLDADDILLKSEFITEEQSKILKTIFMMLKETKFNFGLIHHDLSLKNMIVASHQNVYLLDWGSAGVNIVPHMEIGEILRSSLNEGSNEFQTFLNGYGIIRNEFQKIKPDIIRTYAFELVERHCEERSDEAIQKARVM